MSATQDGRSARRNRRVRQAGVTHGLTKAHIHAAIDVWQRLGRHQFFEEFGGSPAQKYVIVVDGQEIDALALLKGARSIAGLDVAQAYRGDRLNVAEPLRELGFLVENLTNPLEASVADDPLNIRHWLTTIYQDDPANGPSKWGPTRQRRDQGILRAALGIGTGDATSLHRCGLCSIDRPELLVAPTRIKPAPRSSLIELTDVPDVAVTTCTLGCQSLFTHGYLSVADDGSVLVSALPGGVPWSYREPVTASQRQSQPPCQLQFY